MLATVGNRAHRSSHQRYRTNPERVPALRERDNLAVGRLRPEVGDVGAGQALPRRSEALFDLSQRVLPGTLAQLPRGAVHGCNIVRVSET